MLSRHCIGKLYTIRLLLSDILGVVLKSQLENVICCNLSRNTQIYHSLDKQIF